METTTSPSATEAIKEEHRHGKLGAVKNFAEEFKLFIAKGNALELAVGVVIGTAFNAVVDSLVKDIILGIIANIAGKPDFSSFAYGAIKYGAFINSLLNLLIVGFSVFVAIKVVNRLIRKELVKIPHKA